MKRSPSDSRLWQYCGSVLLLALVYIATGKLGLLLAVPPGYATVIWPPSGIAIGALILYGRRLWPGVLLGSFLLNSYVSGAVTPEGIVTVKVLTALGIAVGSTVQTLLGRWLAERLLGLPLNLRRVQDGLLLLLVTGPLTCLTAPTIGVVTLYGAGLLPIGNVAGNWLAWWAGDAFGVLTFLPMMLVAPGGREQVRWRGQALGTLPLMAMLALLLSLGLTFYAWKTASVEVYEQASGEFEALARDNERALLYRIQSYKQALLGGAGFLRGSNVVSRQEWRTYVQDIDPARNFPGVLGLGYVTNTRFQDIAKLEAQAQRDGAPGFKVHPRSAQANYVIVYAEPEADNRAAIGLNLASEKHRREAAEMARDTGEAALTRRIVLIQDSGKTPGFLLLQPIYRLGQEANSVASRRVAFQGWVYVPFVGADFLKGLTKSQGQMLEISVYEGSSARPENLIYSSAGTGHTKRSRFVVSKQIEVMQQKWFVVWSSTSSYDRMQDNDAPIYILVFGLILTCLLGTFLVVVMARHHDTLQWLVEDKHLALPLTIFVVIALGALYLHQQLNLRETEYVTNILEEESRKIDQLISVQTQDRLLALRRMALRWEAAGSTPYNQWREDARNITAQLRGLEAVEWVDANNRVRWVEPLTGQPIGNNPRAVKYRDQMLREPLRAGLISLTPPLTVGESGKSAFVAFVPLFVNGKFDGFLAGIFSGEELLNSIVAEETASDYAVFLKDDGQEFFQGSSAGQTLEPRWSKERQLHIYNRTWTLKVVPSQSLIRNQLTSLPVIILITGLLVGGLLSVTVRYVLISRVKSLQIANREEQMRLLIRNTPAAVAMFNKNLEYIMTSERWMQDYGLQGRDIIGKSHYEIFPEIAQMPYWQDIHQRALRGESFDMHEESWVRADGRTEWIKWAIDPWHDGQDKIGGIVMFTEVISARKEAEAALMRSNALNRAILDSAHTLIIATDTTGHVIVFNRAAERALGYTAEEVIGQVTPALWHDQDEIEQRARELSLELGEEVTPGLTVFIRKAILEGAESHEWTYIRKDGSRFPVNVTMTPLRSSLNHITGYMGVIEDISERKRQQQSLVTSEETFRSAMEHASIGMALVDPTGSWLKVNQALCDLLGYSREELVQTDFQSLTHPDDLEVDLTYVQQVLAGEINAYQMEKRYIRRSGRVIWTLLSVSLVRDSDGRPNYFISQIQDISHQKEVERMKNEFVSVVSHELRTPLTSIRGSLGLIAGVMSMDLPEKARSLIEIALKNSERLVLLINDILDIDKIASGQMQFDMKPESVSNLVRQAVDGHQAYAEKFGVSLQSTLVSEDIKIDVDAARFIQVLTNLLSNATKFSPANGEVRVRVTGDQGKVRVSVQDEGPGIPEEFRERIFGKFSQADASVTRTKGGSGLGLHISKQLVEHMHGTIGFDTVPGVGSTFWMEFPVITEDSMAGSPESDSFASMARRILVCESSEELAGRMKAILEQSGFVVDVASTMEDAHNLIRETEYSALTLDINPPRGESLAFVKQLRANPETLDLPIIVFSMTPDEAQKSLNGDAIGVVDWLDVPIDEGRLLRSVRTVLRSREGVPCILHVEDDADLIQVLASTLQGHAELVGATTLAEAERLLKQHNFALIILDIGMPDGSGLSLLERLKEFGAEATPVLILSASETPAEIQRQVAAAMVKSRMPEDKIVATVLNLIEHQAGSGSPP